MIKPESIDLSTLPYVALSERNALPSTSGIYFAIDSEGTVQYIGLSKNIQHRWLQHHRYNELQSINGIRIAYLAVDDETLLLNIERALIAWFNPVLNRKRKPVGSSTGLKVVVEVDVENLGSDIQQIIKDSKRSPTAIAAEAGMSVGNLYRITAEDNKGVPLATLIRLAKVLKYDLTLLLGDWILSIPGYEVEGKNP